MILHFVSGWLRYCKKQISQRLLAIHYHPIKSTSLPSTVLKLAQTTMDNDVIKTVTYAGLKELLFDRKYFYHSHVGVNYCHLTEDGERAVLEYIRVMAPLMREAEEKALDQRAKDIVMRTLKDQ